MADDDGKVRVRLLKDSRFAHPKDPRAPHVQGRAGDVIKVDEVIAERAVESGRGEIIKKKRKREDKAGPSAESKRSDSDSGSDGTIEVK